MTAMAMGDDNNDNNDNDGATSRRWQRRNGRRGMTTIAMTMVADEDDNDVDGNNVTGNKVEDDGNGATGRLLLMFLGSIVSSTRTPTGNLICALFYYAVIVMNRSPSL